MHISAYAHTHIQVHSLMRALTLSCARTRARMCMHMHTTHTGARAQTRVHPGARGPDYAHTHAPAHEHACMRTHTCKHTRTCTHAHAHTRYAHARSHMQACACTMYMHAYARGTCTHAPAQCSCMCTYVHARTRLHMRPHSCKHTPTYFNRLGQYFSAVSCVYEDLISLWLFGLGCIALRWSRLRRQSWWLRLNDLAGRCQ